MYCKIQFEKDTNGKEMSNEIRIENHQFTVHEKHFHWWTGSETERIHLDDVKQIRTKATGYLRNFLKQKTIESHSDAD